MTDAAPARERTGVSGVILAAGRSSRLGRPKQLLDLGGEPLLRHVVRAAVSSKLNEVILVLGHEAAQIAAAVGDWGQRDIVNPSFADGQSTSVIAGISALDPNAEAVLFLLGDQPLVASEVIDAVIECFRETRAPIVMPTYGGTPANPVLIARELFPQLLHIRGDEGARSIITQHRDLTALIAVSDGPPPRDVDTESDYEHLKTEFESAARLLPIPTNPHPM